MKLLQLSKVCVWSLGLYLIYTTAVFSQTLSVTPRVEEQQLTQQEIVEELTKANIIYLGETHSRPEDRHAQLKILQALHRQNPNIAIAMEMFQRPYQTIVDRYLAGEITEAQLVEQSEYEQRWGFPWESYAPILRFAKANQLPVLALNTPTEVTRKVAREGLESLTAAERQYIPPLAEIRTDNADYRQIIREFYDAHHQAGHGHSENFERFFTAQVLWDETMAETIAQFYQANRDYQVVVIVGQGHVIYGYGIPSRVERRLNPGEVVQRSVLLGEFFPMPSQGDNAIADYIWQHSRD